MTNTIIQEAKPLDLVLGRGSKLSEREGNKKFREMARAQAIRYVTTTDKDEKNTIAETIIKEFEEKVGGRFLRPVPVRSADGRYSEVFELVEDTFKTNKVKQRLRDFASDMMADEDGTPRRRKRAPKVIQSDTSFSSTTPSISSLSSLSSFRNLPTQEENNLRTVLLRNALLQQQYQETLGRLQLAERALLLQDAIVPIRPVLKRPIELQLTNHMAEQLLQQHKRQRLQGNYASRDMPCLGI